MRRSIIVLPLLMLLSACGGGTSAPNPTARPTDAARSETQITLESAATADVTDAVSESAATVEVTEPAAVVRADAPSAATADITSEPDALPTEDATVTDEPTPTDVLPTATLAPLMVEGVLAVLNNPNATQLALISLDSTVIPLIDLPANGRAALCAESPDRRYAAVFAGGLETGALYLMDGTLQPTQTDDRFEYLACVLGTFQFSPDSARYAYIDYPFASSRQVYAAGTLRLNSPPPNAGEQWSADNVVAFDLDNDGVTAVAFYQNDEGDADEAAILHYDLTTEREIATLRPTADNCRFTSASLSNFPDDSGTVALVIGQRCTGEAQMRWQLYTVDAAGSAALVANDPLSGDFVAFARNNNLFFSPDGATLYFTTPDGVAPHTVAIAAVAIAADRAITVPVERQAAFQTFNARDNAIPAFSPDARWLAFMLTSPNSDNFLYALDIADPNNPPIMISAGARGDVVNALAFTPDSARLIYTAGGADEGSDNSVFALDLTTGTEARVRRGTFGGALIIAPDGVRAALNEWVLADNNGDPLLYRAVRLVDLTTNLESTLFEPPFDGANTFSADPIAWRTAF